jgi:hypothetical protein
MTTLTRSERIDLRKQLLILAKNYFNDDEVVTTCGICLALTKQTDTDNDDDNCYYIKMDMLLEEIFGDDHSLGNYTNSHQEWEGRAYMCLFLAEYLQDTLAVSSYGVKCSQILELVKDRLPMYVKDVDEEDDPSPYICDHVKEVGRNFGNSEGIAAAGEICAKIAELIEGEFSLRDWIVKKGYATVYETYDDEQKMQRTRLNFIDDLIKFYKQKGD